MRRAGRVRPSGPADRGQATVETALLLPIIALAMLAVIQIGLVVHARVMVTHAAREGVRAAAVHAGDREIRDVVIASGGLAGDRLAVRHHSSGDRVTVTVRYDAPTNVPLIGSLIGDVELVAEATMRRED
ncbi:MAG: TadE family protein [Actinomycetota bacterium]